MSLNYHKWLYIIWFYIIIKNKNKNDFIKHELSFGLLLTLADAGEFGVSMSRTASLTSLGSLAWPDLHSLCGAFVVIVGNYESIILNKTWIEYSSTHCEDERDFFSSQKMMQYQPWRSKELKTFRRDKDTEKEKRLCLHVNTSAICSSWWHRDME